MKRDVKYNVREVAAKTILQKSGLPDADWVVNPYTGCRFGCKYCYAAFVGPLLPHFVFQKENLKALLRAIKQTGVRYIYLEHINLAPPSPTGCFTTSKKITRNSSNNSKPPERRSTAESLMKSSLISPKQSASPSPTSRPSITTTRKAGKR